MSRKNWDRFFPPNSDPVAPKKGPGLARWLLAAFFVCGVTGAVVAVKVRKPEEPPALAPSDPSATAENSDVLEAPKPIDDAPSEPQAVAEPVVKVKASSTISAAPVTDVAPTLAVAPPSPPAPTPASDVAPTAQLMPPEQPKMVQATPVSHTVARPSGVEEAPPAALQTYRVDAPDETLWTIAKKMLGSGERWTEIARLNPTADTRFTLQIGTVLRLPGDVPHVEQPVASTAPASNVATAVEAATRVALAAVNAVSTLPGMQLLVPEPQRATLVDAQPAPSNPEPPQALHNEGSAPPAPAPKPALPPATEAPAVPEPAPCPQPVPLAAQPQATPPSPEPAPQPCVPPPTVAAPPSSPPAPAQPPSSPPPAPTVAVAPNSAPVQPVNPPTPVREPSAVLPLPVLMPSVPKARVEPPAPALPITGTYICDCAGAEVHLPGKLVQQAGDHGVLYVALGPDQQSVWVYTAAALEQLNEQLQHLPGGDDQVQRCRRLCYSRFEMVEIKNGKPAISMKLPAELAEAIGLHDKAVIIGARDHYELWDAQRWQQYCKAAASSAP
jgi:DNA-binding transcriptional regulator/RsmH inhibitor MraZ